MQFKNFPRIFQIVHVLFQIVHEIHGQCVHGQLFSMKLQDPANFCV